MRYRTWNYLVFKHNQHQVEEAEALSKELGFAHFFHKKALGFVSNDRDRVAKEGIYVFNEQGQCDYVLELQMEGKWQNSVIRDYLKTSNFKKIEGEDVESDKALKTFKLEENRSYTPPPFVEDTERPLQSGKQN